MRVKIYQINSNRDKAHFRFSNLAETTKLMQGNRADRSDRGNNHSRSAYGSRSTYGSRSSDSAQCSLFAFR